MATCKECIHSECCFMQYGKTEALKWQSEHGCKNFKDRSRFVELPCKVGDTVYWDILGKPVEDEITNITIYDNCTRVFLKKGISFDIEDIGRMIFLSREQAERALKERESGA